MIRLSFNTSLPHWFSVLLLTFLWLPGIADPGNAETQDPLTEAKRLEAVANAAGLFNDESLSLIIRFKDYADSFHLAEQQFQANYLLGKYHLLRLYSDKALGCFQEAARLAQNIGDQELHGFAMDRMGIAYINLDKPDSALLCFQTSMDLYNSNGLEHRVWTPLHGISQLYAGKGDYEKAIAYGEQALASLDGYDEPIAKTILLDHMITLASESEKAEVYAKYLDLYLSTIDPDKLADDNSHLAIFYHSKDDPKDQIRDIKHAISLLSTQEPTMSLVNAHYRLGEVYYKEKQYEDAIAVWLKGLDINEKINVVGFKTAFYKEIAEAYDQMRNHEMAIVSLKKYYALRDSIVNSENTKKLDELQLKYETAQKEKTITQQEFAIRQKTRERNILAVAGLCLLISVFVVIRFLRIRLKTQKLMARKEMESLQQEHHLAALRGMVKGQEEERKRIAFDLHDGLGGLLSTAKHQIEKLLEKVDPSALNGEATRTSALIDRACEDVRRIAHNMMPHALMKMGLNAAIGDMVNLLQNSTEVEISFQNLTDVDRLDEEREIMLYRIIQELVQNAIKHAEASSVIIQLSQHNDILSLVVEDDGKGFDVNSSNQHGLGIKSLESRVKFLHGQMDMYSSSETGTTVTIEIPLSDHPLHLIKTTS